MKSVSTVAHEEGAELSSRFPSGWEGKKRNKLILPSLQDKLGVSRRQPSIEPFIARSIVSSKELICIDASEGGDAERVRVHNDSMRALQAMNESRRVETRRASDSREPRRQEKGRRSTARQVSRCTRICNSLSHFSACDAPSRSARIEPRVTQWQAENCARKREVKKERGKRKKNWSSQLRSARCISR